MGDWDTLNDGRQCIKNSVGNHVVSTVEMPYTGHIGIQGLGYVFETMVFNEVGDDVDCERYGDIDEAKEGHQGMVKKWAEYLRTP